MYTCEFLQEPTGPLRFKTGSQFWISEEPTFEAMDCMLLTGSSIRFFWLIWLTVVF